MAESPKVMIVEDEFIIARDIELKLKREGFQVAAMASSGSEAIELAAQSRPDLILMDIKLDGDMDGIEAAGQIEQRIDVPIIYLTALIDEETRKRAKETFPFGYILKPVENRELIVSIEMALHKFKLDKELKRQLRQTNAMRLVDQAILKNHDMQQTFRDVLMLTTQQLEVDAAAILTISRHSHTLQYACGSGFQNQAFRNTYFPSDASWPGKAVMTRENIILSDLAAPAVSDIPLWVHQEGFLFYVAAPLIIKDQVKGVLELFHRSTHPIEDGWLDFLQLFTNQVAIAVDNAFLLEDLITANAELSQAYNATIEGWSAALELRDLETEGHSQRVTEMTHRLAVRMGIQGKQLEHIRRGALLHDVGKMGIPDQILLRPGPLSEDDWKIMHRHPEYAYDLLCSIPFLKPALDIPYCHHEKWDGSGYPQGLVGEQIPLAARIFSVVDVWDAMLSSRPYHKAVPEESVLEYIREQSGKQFDPRIVEEFLLLRESELRDRAILSDRPELGGLL